MITVFVVYYDYLKKNFNWMYISRNCKRQQRQQKLVWCMQLEKSHLNVTTNIQNKYIKIELKVNVHYVIKVWKCETRLSYFVQWTKNLSSVKLFKMMHMWDYADCIRYRASTPSQSVGSKLGKYMYVLHRYIRSALNLWHYHKLCLMDMIWCCCLNRFVNKTACFRFDYIYWIFVMYVHGKCNVDIISGLYSGKSHLQSYNANTLLSNFIKCNLSIYVCVCPT